MDHFLGKIFNFNTGVRIKKLNRPRIRDFTIPEHSGNGDEETISV